MAFRRLPQNNRRVQMVSLIDLIFILLLFFIVTSVLVRLTQGEARLYIPSPKNEPGEAQILIQILDSDKFLWIDYTAIDTLYRYRGRFRNQNDPKAKVGLLLQKMTLNTNGLFERLEKLKAESRKKRTNEYFLLIRCPDALPYSYPLKIIQTLVDMPNLDYGCVSGTIEDIINSKNMIVERNLIQINF